MQGYDTYQKKLTESKKRLDPQQLMQDAQNDYNAAMKDALQSGLKAYDEQRNQVARDNRDRRSQVYQDARVSAIGNNEALAARGLAGGLYDNAKGGYSETSRIAQDMNLRTNLALQDQAAAKALNDINTDLARFEMQAKTDAAKGDRQTAGDIIKMLLDQDQFDRRMKLAYDQMGAKAAPVPSIQRDPYRGYTPPKSNYSPGPLMENKLNGYIYPSSQSNIGIVESMTRPAPGVPQALPSRPVQSRPTVPNNYTPPSSVLEPDIPNRAIYNPARLPIKASQSLK